MDECGDGFWLGSPDGEVAVRFAAAQGSVVDGEHPAQATVAGLEAALPHGTVVELGSRELTNDARECFAG